MSFIIKNLTLRNFLSVGQCTQSINFDNKELTLVIGENLDLGPSTNGLSSNAAGKTTAFQAISYVLFGVPINKIRKDNLINRTNAKGMLCSLEFSVKGVDYKIERGRRPNILKFYVNSKLIQNDDTDQSQGDSRETQTAIEHAIGMSADMFRQIVILNTYTEPFLSMSANDQRNIIEQLLGITLLTEKAELLKEQVRKNKDQIQLEEFKIKAIEEANKRVQEQIDATKRRQKVWKNKHDDDLNKLALAYNDLTEIDIEKELQSHTDLAIYNIKRKEIDNLNTLISQCDALKEKEHRIISKLEKEITALKTNKCYACGQDLHDKKHEEVLHTKEEALEEAKVHLLTINTQLNEHQCSLYSIGKLVKPPKTFYNTETEAIKHSSQIENILHQIEIKSNEIDPYQEQIHEMENQALQEIKFDSINELTRFGDHLKFLLELLSSKDSFVRKKIIDQNLTYLNTRLTHYLEKIGLPHDVVFKNDLSVEITELGRDLDFHNCSRGEMNRLILGLNFAFRDVWENLYYPINALFIDELIDNGTDAIGTENTLSILKDMNRRRNKSIWMISHKEDLVNRVDNIIKAVKEGGFTTYMSPTGDK